jgi:hypothetical protein
VRLELPDAVPFLALYARRDSTAGTKQVLTITTAGP